MMNQTTGKKNKTVVLVVIALIVFILSSLAGGGYYYYTTSSTTPAASTASTASTTASSKSAPATTPAGSNTPATTATTTPAATSSGTTTALYAYTNQSLPSASTYQCTSNVSNYGGNQYCILPVDAAISTCNADATCTGYGAAIHNAAWDKANPGLYQLFNTTTLVGSNDWEFFKKGTTATPANPAATTFVVHSAANPYRWILHGPSSDTSDMYGWSGGFTLRAFTTPVPHATKYIVKYAGSPTRMLFYRSEDEANYWGWGTANDPNWGNGLVLYLYPNVQPNTTKYYYQYANSPMRTCISTNDQSSAGWTYNDANVGSGGVFYAPNA